MLCAIDEALGVPLHAVDEAGRRALERLDRSVLGPADHAQRGSDRVRSLVVVRVDGDPAGADQGGKPAAGLELDLVRGAAAGLGLAVVLRRQVGQVLMQRAAERDIQRLRSPADRQHWLPQIDCAACERKLEPVELGLGGTELRVGLGAVGRRIQVGTT